MNITLYREEIINAIRSISHREVSAIEDTDARYRAEAGSEKMTEIYSCIWEAVARVSSRCRRWLLSGYLYSGDNVVNLPETFTFEFVLSERRAINADSLKADMHVFVVEYALSKFYSIVSQVELSNKHSLLAIDAGNSIDSILFTKLPPRV